MEWRSLWGAWVSRDTSAVKASAVGRSSVWKGAVPFSLSHFFHKKISTHLLTLLIMRVILHIEQKRGDEEPENEGSGSSDFPLRSSFT